MEGQIPIGPGLATAIYQEWNEFFDSEAKLGYLAPGLTGRDHKEFFHIYPGGRDPAGEMLQTVNSGAELRHRGWEAVPGGRHGVRR